MALKDKINLEELAYTRANFAHSEREPTSVDQFVKGPRPFYYMWKDEEGTGMDILTFKDPNKPETAKLFRYTQKQIYSGVDLEKDKPKFFGRNVIEVLEQYIITAKHQK